MRLQFWRSEECRVALIFITSISILLYSHHHNIDLQTSMNEWTHFFIKIYLSHFILERVDVSVVCERWVERHIYSERGLLLPGARGCQRLHPLASSSEVLLIGCVFLAQLQFSALYLNLTAWFSSRGLLPVTHLLYPTALIMLSSSCLLIKMWQFAKAHGVTRNELKIHVICYITHFNLEW